MRITADTNIFVRLFAGDDAEQFALAQGVLNAATLVVIPMPVLCELAWVLRSRLPAGEIADAIEGVSSRQNALTDRVAARAGLAMLRAGGDFADGVIAESGAALGGELFVSFDARAVALRAASGGRAATPEALTAQS